MILYTVLGGFLAVAYTDLIQTVIMLEPIVISLAVSLILMWSVSKATHKPETATPKLILAEVTND